MLGVNNGQVWLIKYLYEYIYVKGGVYFNKLVQELDQEVSYASYSPFFMPTLLWTHIMKQW